MRSLFWIFVLLAGCGGGSKVTHGSHETLPAGNWTIDGVRLGSSLAEIEAHLGKGERFSPPQEKRLPIFRFNQGQTIVYFDSELKAGDVRGKKLLNDKKVVLESGQAESTVVSALGEGYIVAISAPKGGDVIATGSVHVCTEYYYKDSKNRFKLAANADGILGEMECGGLGQLRRPGAGRGD